MNRRAFELVIVAIVLTRPVLGAARLWAHKTWNATQPGSLSHTVADAVIILS